jgi:zinc transporter
MRAFIYHDAKAVELPFEEGVIQSGKVTLLWLHLDGKIGETRRWIEAQADIPEIARTALLALETRPRSDIFGNGAIINLRALSKNPDDDPDALVSIRFWAEHGRIISVSLREPVAIDAVIAEFLDAKLLDCGDVLTAFADAITDGLDPDVAELGDELDEVETMLETRGVFAMRRKVSALRSQAIGFRRFVTPQRQALEKLAGSQCGWLDDHDRLHLREASDRFARMAEELESVRERAAIVHEELTDLHAEKMDARSLLISIYALVFLPLTFITGLFGMNVPIPYHDDPRAFWVVLAVCVLITLGGLFWFLQRRWISRSDSLD